MTNGSFCKLLAVSHSCLVPLSSQTTLNFLNSLYRKWFYGNCCVHLQNGKRLSGLITDHSLLAYLINFYRHHCRYSIIGLENSSVIKAKHFLRISRIPAVTTQSWFPCNSFGKFPMVYFGNIILIKFHIFLCVYSSTPTATWGKNVMLGPTTTSEPYLSNFSNFFYAAQFIKDEV